jgi:cytochrome c-type biogenesis protein
MDPGEVTLGLAFLAGLASFLSPCVIVLVPIYITYLGGRSVTSNGVIVGSRWVTFSHGIAFVLGFSIFFIGLGAAVSSLGALLYEIRIWLARIGGIITIIFGLQTIGLINIPFLNYDTRRQIQPNTRLGYLSSALLGLTFSAGWSPCIGPILGAVLTIPLVSGDVKLGTILLTAYSAGLALPFLLAALGMGQATEIMRRYTKPIRFIAIVMGVLMVIFGILLLTGRLDLLSQYGLFIDFGL